MVQFLVSNFKIMPILVVVQCSQKMGRVNVLEFEDIGGGIGKDSDFSFTFSDIWQIKQQLKSLVIRMCVFRYFPFLKELGFSLQKFFEVGFTEGNFNVESVVDVDGMLRVYTVV